MVLEQKFLEIHHFFLLIPDNTALCDLMTALNNFGRIRISKTFPALCSAMLDKTVSCHLKARVTVITVDYHGNPRTSGSDPITVELKSDQSRDTLPVDMIDEDNGTYKIEFVPHQPGQHKLYVTIFNRPIRESPFCISVTEHVNPVLRIGTRGCGQLEFVQPVNVACDAEGRIIVLDTGKHRITYTVCIKC